MKRTTVYLGENEMRLLQLAALEVGASRSSLIRLAIRSTYGEPSVADRIDAVRRSAGAWKDRELSGRDYVDTVRGDLNLRLRRVGFE